MVNYELRTMHVVRKVILFQDDKKWATLQESVTGIEYDFQCRDLFFPRLQRYIKCGIAICADIQYKDFDPALKETKKLAHYQVTNNT